MDIRSADHLPSTLSEYSRIGLVTLVISLFLTGCKQESEVSKTRTVTKPAVVVEPVQFSNEVTRLEAVGTSRALQSVELHPATSGEVTAVRFKPGEYVQKGDVLIELDSREEKLAVELAEVRLTEAQRLFERYQNSVASGATLPTTLDAARTELEASRIELNRATIALDFRTIEAPFSGHVGLTDLDVGDRIQPETIITTLDDRSALMVSFAVPEVMVGKLKVGDDVSVNTWNVTGTQVVGQIVELDSRINPDTRTFLARAKVANPEDGLRPGMSFRVALDLYGDAYPILAEISLQWGADGAYIWSVNQGKAERLPVNIIQRKQGRVLVSAPLAPGDMVVVEGIQRLRAGREVTPEVLTAKTPNAPVDSGAD